LLVFQKIARGLGLALSDRSLLRDIATLGGGAIVAQAINFSFYPLLTRQYSPEEFGDLGVFLSFIAVLTPAAGLTYYMAIILPSSDRKALRILLLSCLVGLAMAALLAAVVAFATLMGGTSALHLRHEGLAHLFAPCVAVMAVMLALQQWQTRERQFIRLSLSGLVQALSANIPRVILGLQNPTSLTLVATYVLSLLAQTAILVPWRRAGSIRGTFSTSTRKLWATAVHFRRYPMYRAPQELLSATSQGLPILLLAYFYGPTEAGLYVLARSIIGGPLDLIGNAVGGAIYPRYAEARNVGSSIAHAIREHTVALFLLGILPLVVIIPFLPFAFSVLFGERWNGAGHYGMFLSLWLFSNVLNVPSVRAIPVLAAERLQLAFGVMTMIGRAAALGVTAVLGGTAVVAVALYCVVGVTANLLLTLAIYKRARALGTAQDLSRHP
jgi:O-antigen/teichoic acid export membrane protein